MSPSEIQSMSRSLPQLPPLPLCVSLLPPHLPSSHCLIHSPPSFLGSQISTRQPSLKPSHGSNKVSSTWRKASAKWQSRSNSTLIKSTVCWRRLKEPTIQRASNSSSNSRRRYKRRYLTRCSVWKVAKVAKGFHWTPRSHRASLMGLCCSTSDRPHRNNLNPLPVSDNSLVKRHHSNTLSIQPMTALRLRKMLRTCSRTSMWTCRTFM